MFTSTDDEMRSRERKKISDTKNLKNRESAVEYGSSAQVYQIIARRRRPPKEKC